MKKKPLVHYQFNISFYIGLQAETIAPGQPVTSDHNQNRVRLTVDRNGYVIRPVPRRG